MKRLSIILLLLALAAPGMAADLPEAAQPAVIPVVVSDTPENRLISEDYIVLTDGTQQYLRIDLTATEIRDLAVDHVLGGDFNPGANRLIILDIEGIRDVKIDLDYSEVEGESLNSVEITGDDCKIKRTFIGRQK